MRAADIEREIEKATASYDVQIDLKFIETVDIFRSHGIADAKIAAFIADWRRLHVAPNRLQLQQKLRRMLEHPDAVSLSVQ